MNLNTIKEKSPSFARPSEWNQATWRCGTGMCFAGHAAAMTGRLFSDPEDNGIQSDVLISDGRIGVAFASEVVQYPRGTVLYDIPEFARRQLGLTQDQADLLFESDNTLTDIRNLIDEWKAEASVS